MVFCDVTLGSLNQLIKRYKPESCYITHVFTDDYKKIEGTVSEAYFHFDALAAKYEKYVFEKDCPPVDEALLSSMAKYESGIIKMIERVPELLKYRLNAFPSMTTPSYEDRVRQYHCHLRYWNHMLDAANIKIAIFDRYPHEIYSYIIHCLCEIKGIAIVSAATFGQMPSFSYFTSNFFDPCPDIVTTYQKFLYQFEKLSIDEIMISSKEIENIFTKFSNKDSNKTPIYMNPQKKWLRNNIALAWSSIHKEGLLYTCYIIWGWSCWNILNFSKNRKLIKAYDLIASEADYDKSYIYFPLHYQPEGTTNPLGGVFVHQFLAISMISFYLPPNVKIYVKEHPAQFKKSYGRNISLYHDLSKLPNVQLVERSSDTYKLLENCIAVASITGTAGFEGLFMEKPFLMFGSNINMYAPGTFNIRNNEDCKKALDYILKNGAKHTLKEMKIYLKALDEVLSCCTAYAFDLTTYGIELLDKEKNIATLVEGYARIIDEQLELNKSET